MQHCISLNESPCESVFLVWRTEKQNCWTTGHVPLWINKVLPNGSPKCSRAISFLQQPLRSQEYFPLGTQMGMFLVWHLPLSTFLCSDFSKHGDESPPNKGFVVGAVREWWCAETFSNSFNPWGSVNLPWPIPRGYAPAFLFRCLAFMSPDLIKQVRTLHPLIPMP